MTSAPLFRGLQRAERERLQTVCRFASLHLGSVLRRTKESYAQHGIEVAMTLREQTDDCSLLSIAILHDLPVHPDGVALLARSPLLPSERKLVMRMHELRRLHIDASADDLDTVIDAFVDEPRLLRLRMAHRLNDIRHVRRFSAGLRRQIAREALHMYSAIAGRIGMHAWRSEMEDVCFAVVHPTIARRVQSMRNRSAILDRTCLILTSRFLQRELRRQGIPCHMESRIKGLYSTYRKMVIKRRSFHELTDRLAVRIIVRDTMDCYKTLAVVHACMHPIPGKLKDYIGAPKENDYRSIHTVVYPLAGVTEQPIEIQIRSEEMHRVCEYGMPSHTEYKSAMYAIASRPTRVSLFRNLQSLREEARSPGQFASVLRHYFRDDQIAVFDRANNLYHLGRPATALDFVCHVYPKRVGMLRSVRINGRDRPVGTELHDGDTVDPIFSRERMVISDWAHACRHPRARSLVRAARER